jgi:hypothetical protein
MKTTDEMTDAAPLVVQARTAYEQKRTKECIALLRQVLASDSTNREALAIQEAVFTDIERDLVDARALLKDAQRDGGKKYQKAAEIILLKILYLDPTHAEAKALLGNARGSSEPAPAAAAVPAEQTPRGEELMFTAAPVPFERQTAAKSSGLSGKLPIVIVAALILAVGGVLFYGFSSKRSTTTPTTDARQTPAPVPDVPKPIAPSPSVATRPVTPTTPAPTVDPKVAAANAAANDVAAPPVEKPKGSLAVSSATSAEIYIGGKSFGETPTTLQLNAGKQTIEYRHGNLKTTMTHDIKANQTTTAFVTFELDLQINARPWAQVFIEGSTRKALGQTPLGSVKVPIGSVLTFENPNFQSKTYRVTDKDSAIQIVFP